MGGQLLGRQFDVLRLLQQCDAGVNCRSPRPEKRKGLADDVMAGSVDVLTPGKRVSLAEGVGPCAAIKKLQSMTCVQRAAWFEEARLEAILGGLRLSTASLKAACVALWRLSVNVVCGSSRGALLFARLCWCRNCLPWNH